MRLLEPRRLQELLSASQTLMTVYLMKAQLRALWTTSCAWQQWLRHARESQIASLMLFAKHLSSYWRVTLS